MTNILHGVKTSFTSKVVAVSALAFIGAAGLGAGSASAATSGSQDNTGLTTSSSSSASASKERGKVTTANYKQTTKYVMYENMIDASFTQADFDKMQSQMSEQQMLDFFKNSGYFMNGWGNKQD